MWGDTGSTIVGIAASASPAVREQNEYRAKISIY
jgi:hypothetical protein